MSKGLVHIYYGNGKGKTTAAFGQALRAIGHGYRVAVIQFFKSGGFTGEFLIAPRLEPHLKIWQFGKKCPYAEEIRKGKKQCFSCNKCMFNPYDAKDRFRQKKIILEAWRRAKEKIFSLEYDLVILDEVNNIIRYNLINSHDVLTVLKEKPPELEIILTGRSFPQNLIDFADYVSEIKAVKHPFQKLIKARRGIEY